MCHITDWLMLCGGEHIVNETDEVRLDNVGAVRSTDNRLPPFRPPPHTHWKWATRQKCRSKERLIWYNRQPDRTALAYTQYLDNINIWTQILTLVHFIRYACTRQLDYALMSVYTVDISGCETRALRVWSSTEQHVCMCARCAQSGATVGHSRRAYARQAGEPMSIMRTYPFGWVVLDKIYDWVFFIVVCRSTASTGCRDSTVCGWDDVGCLCAHHPHFFAFARIITRSGWMFGLDYVCLLWV